MYIVQCIHACAVWIAYHDIVRAFNQSLIDNDQKLKKIYHLNGMSTFQ